MSDQMIDLLDANEKFPVWQSLISIAYGIYQSDRDLSYEDFVDSLDDVSAAAVALKNLNYQVLNGGFKQWYDNKYHVDLENLQGILQDNFQSQTGRKISLILTEIADYIECADGAVEEFDKAMRGISTKYLDAFQESFNEMVDKDLGEMLENETRQYCDINDEFEVEIEKFLASTDEGQAALKRLQELADEQALAAALEENSSEAKD